MGYERFKKNWARFWMRHAGRGSVGRFATRLAVWAVPPYYGRVQLAGYTPKGYISPLATLSHRDLRLGAHVYLDDRVLIYADKGGGRAELADGVHLHRDTISQTGAGGWLTIGSHTHIQPRCQLSAYKAPIQIGSRVEIGPNCAFYSYRHGMAPQVPIREQPLSTKGGIVIADDAWLGFGVIVLDGVRIGEGAVVGAGSVVTKDIPKSAIAFGVPARIFKMREEIGPNHGVVST